METTKEMKATAKAKTTPTAKSEKTAQDCTWKVGPHCHHPAKYLDWTCNSDKPCPAEDSKKSGE